MTAYELHPNSIELKVLREHSGGRDRRGNHYECVCTQCKTIRVKFNIPEPTGRTTC